MRPGLLRPGRRGRAVVVETLNIAGFNEAGAASPRKTVGVQGETENHGAASMRPGLLRPGRLQDWGYSVGMFIKPDSPV